MRMNRIGLFLSTLLLLFLLACNTDEHVAPNAAKAKGYNIVLVVVDDLNDWVSPLGGHPQTQTPNFDRLAAQSLTFANAYCAAPTCNPSRVAMLTGVQPFNSGVYANPDDFRKSERLKNAMTLPQLFKEHGYKTMSTGKVFQTPEGERADPISWSSIRTETGERMQSSANMTANKLANGMAYTNRFESLFDWEEQNVPINQTSDFQNTAWVAEQIRTNEYAFFIACGIYKPHLPLYLPEGSFDDWPLDSLKEAPFLADDLDDLPSEVEGIVRSKNPRSDFNRLKNAQKQKEATRAFLAAIAYADQCLGNILDAIEENGDSTILIVVGDHGWHLGEKQHYRKFTLWERATHVPMFIRLPGAENGGSRVEEFVSLLDIYPTMANFCGLPVSAENDGFDLNYLFENPKSIKNRSVLTTLGPEMIALRYKNWRYIKYPKGEELYNLLNDPNEWHNLANNPGYRAKMDSLQAFLPTSFQPSVSGKGHVVFEY